MVKLSYSIIDSKERKELSKKGRELLSEMLEDMGETPCRENILSDANGRPYIVGRKDLDFNISHSGNMVVCALCKGGRVGVDVEPVKISVSAERQARFAERFFSKGERNIVLKDPMQFSRVWTAKEAVIKRLGVGLAVKLSGIDTCDLPADVKIERFEIDGYTVAVCVDKNETVSLFQL